MVALTDNNKSCDQILLSVYNTQIFDEIFWVLMPLSVNKKMIMYSCQYIVLKISKLGDGKKYTQVDNDNVTTTSLAPFLCPYYQI